MAEETLRWLWTGNDTRMVFTPTGFRTQQQRWWFRLCQQICQTFTNVLLAISLWHVISTVANTVYISTITHIHLRKYKSCTITWSWIQSRQSKGLIPESPNLSMWASSQCPLHIDWLSQHPGNILILVQLNQLVAFSSSRCFGHIYQYITAVYDSKHYDIKKYF